jgi:methionyl-tRNA formyltransferase
MGSPEFAVPSLRALIDARYHVIAVYTQPDRPSGRGRRLMAPPAKQAAEEAGILIYQPPSLRRGGATEELHALAPDLIVVAAYGQILRPAVIDLPRFGCLNVHASLLPRHRGAAPVAAAILAGDAETGVSIMQIDPGLDTGPVLSRRATAILDTDTTGTLTERLARLGAALLIDTLPGWIDGTVEAVPQDDSTTTLAPPLQKDAGRIDWSKPAIRLWREVRAYNPWPICNTTLSGEALQILAAWPLPLDVKAAPAGMVVALPPDASEATPPESRPPAGGFAVATGEGLLVPLQLRRAGRNVTSAAEFARGARDLLGSKLG